MAYAALPEGVTEWDHAGSPVLHALSHGVSLDWSKLCDFSLSAIRDSNMEGECSLRFARCLYICSTVVKVMPDCDVCLNLDWDLYPPGKHVNAESADLLLSVSRGCVPCRIIRCGIELMEEKVILPAGGKSHLVCPCMLQISLRKHRSLHVEIRSIDDDAVRKNYEMYLEFFSIAGTSLPCST